NPYLPTIKSVNDPGTTLGRGLGRSGVAGGGGPKSAVARKTLCVLVSTVIVRAPLCVGTLSTTLNLSGESSWTMVNVPSPFELNAKPVPGSKPLASTPLPVGNVVITFPLSESTTAISLLPPQPMKSL